LFPTYARGFGPGPRPSGSSVVHCPVPGSYHREALGTLKAEKAVEVLIERVKDPKENASVRAAAEKALRPLLETKPIDWLIERVNDPKEHTSVREAAVVALGTLKAERAVEARSTCGSLCAPMHVTPLHEPRRSFRDPQV
jgi:HEAT repeat protein